MTDAVLFALSGSLTIIGIAALAALFAIMWRRWRKAVRLSQSLPAMPFAGPLARLDFAQSLDPVLFAQAAEEETVAYANSHLRDLISDATSLTLQSLKSLRLWRAPPDMLVAPSTDAWKAIRAGTATIQRLDDSKRRLPQIVDVQNRQIVEVMREVGGGRKAIATGAALSAIVVSAAHMIAAADLARKLKAADEKLENLLAYRRNDQMARLERIYTAARELLGLPLDEARRMELWRLRGELRELRVTWRREFEHHLMQIEDPAQAQWLTRRFTRRSTADTRIVGKISDGQLHLRMLEYLLRLDCVLAVSSDTWEGFETTLEAELAEIARVGEVLKERANFISKTGHASATQMIEELDDMIANYRGLLHSQAATVDGVEVQSVVVALLEQTPADADGSAPLPDEGSEQGVQPQPPLR